MSKSYNKINNKDNQHTRKNKKIQKTDIIYKYNKIYKNTPYIPKSTFVSNMIILFPAFIKNTPENELFVKFTDLFDINYKVKNKNKIKINTGLKTKEGWSLDKILEYSFYLTSKKFFIIDDTFTSPNNVIRSIKTQIGKDILRSNVVINNIDYEVPENVDLENYDKIADNFYEILITYFRSNNQNINFNNINKLALLCCQNMTNFLSDRTSLYIGELIRPEMSVILGADRKIKIEITSTTITLIIIFQSKLIISQDSLLDPESPCGNLFFKIKFDILNNLFEITKFTININTVTCKVPKIKDTNDNKSGIAISFDSNLIPVAVSSAGIITTPFILGAI